MAETETIKEYKETNLVKDKKIIQSDLDVNTVVNSEKNNHKLENGDTQCLTSQMNGDTVNNISDSEQNSEINDVESKTKDNGDIVKKCTISENGTTVDKNETNEIENVNNDKNEDSLSENPSSKLDSSDADVKNTDESSIEDKQKVTDSPQLNNGEDKKEDTVNSENNTESNDTKEDQEEIKENDPLKPEDNGEQSADTSSKPEDGEDDNKSKDIKEESSQKKKSKTPKKRDGLKLEIVKRVTRSASGVSKQVRYTEPDPKLFIDEDDDVKITKEVKKDVENDIQMIEQSDPLAISDADVRKAKEIKKETSGINERLKAFKSRDLKGSIVKGKDNSNVIIIDTNTLLKGQQSQSSVISKVHNSTTVTQKSVSIGSAQYKHGSSQVASQTTTTATNIQTAIQAITGGNPAMQGLQSAYLNAIQQVLQTQGGNQISNPHYIATLQQYYNTLGALQDDAYVIEAPSFIVPYVMEGNPKESIKDYLSRIKKEQDQFEKKQKEKEEKKDKESKDEEELKDKEAKDKELKDKKTKDEAKDKEGKDEEIKAKENEKESEKEDETKDAKKEEKIDEKEESKKESDKDEKMEVDEEKDKEKVQTEEEQEEKDVQKKTKEIPKETEEEKSKKEEIETKEEKGETEKGKPQKDKKEETKNKTDITDINEEDKDNKENKEEEQENKENKETKEGDEEIVEVQKEDLRHLGRWESYYRSALGKFMLDLGLNHVQEFIQSDLLRMQKKKLEKKTVPTKEEMMSVKLLDKQLKATRLKSQHLNVPVKMCRFCSYKTESNMAMERHLESPHMMNYTYKCNFCEFETRGPQVILFHMEAEHNVRGRLERAPAFFQCPMCPFEDNNKSKMTRHTISCAKKFKPERNCELTDWEPPAKIPKINRGRTMTFGKTVDALRMTNLLPKAIGGVGGLNLQAALTNSLLAAASPSSASAALAGRGRGRPVGSYKNGTQNVGNRTPGSIVYSNRPSYMQSGSHLNLSSQTVGSNNRSRLLTSNASGSGNLLPGLAASSSITIQSVQNKSGSSKSPQQPSISITPLPRAGGQPSASNKSSSGSSSNSQRPAFVICEICDGYIKDLEQLRNHMNLIHKVKIHPKMIYNRPPLNCQKCQHRFFTDQGLERHLLGTHGLVTSSMQEAANKGKDAGRCPICGKVFQWKLLNHVSRDHKMTLKPAHLSYKCTVCTATFNMYRLFENHVYSAHSVVNKSKSDGSPGTASASATTTTTTSSSSQSSKKSSGSNNSETTLKINDEITIIPQPAGKSSKADSASTESKAATTPAKNESNSSVNKEITITKVGSRSSGRRSGASGVEVISLDESPNKRAAEDSNPPPAKKKARDTSTAKKARNS